MKAKELLDQLGVDEKEVRISEANMKTFINFNNGYEIELQPRDYIFVQYNYKWLCTLNQESSEMIPTLKNILKLEKQKKEKA